MRLSGIVTLMLLASASSALAQPPERPRPMPAPSSAAAVRHGAPTPAAAPSPVPRAVQAAPPVQHVSAIQLPSPVQPVPPIQASPRSPFAAGPFTYAPRYSSGQPHRPRPPHSGSWGYGYYGLGTTYENVDEYPRTDESRRQPDNQMSIDGVIFLDVEPRSADVYLDGFYVGASDDFAFNGLTLRTGRHWIDLRRPGYETLTFPVNITAAQVMRYRGALSPSRTLAASTEPARGPQTMYVIAGCYAGNRPPVASALASGCDISRVRVLPDAR